jgi:PAP2 superfamily.
MGLNSSPRGHGGTVVVLALLGAIGTLIIGLTLVPWPGDVALTRGVQAILPAGPHWALWVSSWATAPREFVLVAIAVLLGALFGGWRVGLLAIPSFIGMWLMDRLLRLFILQPRPTAALVHVHGVPPPGSAFPSTFALIYGATFGFLLMLALLRLRGAPRVLLLVVGGLPLLIGAAARLVLGAHWPSDLLVSYLIALAWAGALLCSPRRCCRRQPEAPQAHTAPPTRADETA